MQKIRVLGATIAIGGIALLTGCVGYDPGYGGGGYVAGGGYSQPYYSDPVVVAPAPVYIQGGGYYDGGRRPYYDGGRPYYNNRPGYPGVRPGYPGGVRPGYGGGGRAGFPNAGVRPGAGIQQPIRPGGLPATGRPALPNVPGTPIRSTTNPTRDQ